MDTVLKEVYCELHSSGLEYGAVARSCDRSNGALGPIKR
jgi:hypothetical protein